MNFNKIIRKSTVKNHNRNRIYRISVAKEDHLVIKLLSLCRIKFKTVLEIGCSTGYVLEKIRLKYKSKCFGVDISKNAIAEGKKIFRKIHLRNEFFENSGLNKKKYDLIICGFFLFLMPLNKTLKFFSKIDESLDKNSHVIIYDFHNKKFKKKKYKHDKGLNVYRWDYKKLLLALPNYKLYKIIKRYNYKMKDYEEISILKKIKI